VVDFLGIVKEVYAKALQADRTKGYGSRKGPQHAHASQACRERWAEDLMTFLSRERGRGEAEFQAFQKNSIKR
jgi:hypothetical protein